MRDGTGSVDKNSRLEDFLEFSRFMLHPTGASDYFSTLVDLGMHPSIKIPGYMLDLSKAASAGYIIGTLGAKLSTFF